MNHEYEYPYGLLKLCRSCTEDRELYLDKRQAQRLAETLYASLADRRPQPRVQTETPQPSQPLTPPRRRARKPVLAERERELALSY